jgi:tetratricopeptide (TPR) repeat protein
VLVAIAAIIALALGAMQLGSDAIFARAGEPASLPAHLPSAAGVAIYRAASRIAPAPYIDTMLARAALDRGDLTQAQQYALRLPASARRDDLLARIAQARGQDDVAQRYFVRAADIEAIDSAVRGLASRDPARAYALESALMRRLRAGGTHPDFVAEAYWQMGTLAWSQSKRQLAMQDYGEAVQLSPLSEKYLLSAGFAAYELRQDRAAKRYFTRVIGVDPASADAYAGAGMVALRQGNRAQALQYAARARASNPHAGSLATLESLLRE